MEPQCAACLATLASLYLAQGDLLRAVDAQEAALRRWPDKQKIPQELTVRLEQYRRARQADGHERHNAVADQPNGT